MLIVPAIDLKGGKVVRLVHGDFSQEIVYGDDPVAVARKWADAGAARLHVVDLDGALSGTPAHTEQIVKIAKAVRIPVQTGGGIRSIDTAAKYLEAGVESVIVGTKACLDESFVTNAVKRFAGRIIGAVDAKRSGGQLRVTTAGWVQTEYLKPEALLRRLLAQQITAFIFTDVSRDGSMTGPAVASHQAMLAVVGGKAQYIASGGIGSLEDLQALQPLEKDGLTGVIVGRALYENKLDLRKAIEACSRKGSSPVSTSKPDASSKGSGSAA